MQKWGKDMEKDVIQMSPFMSLIHFIRKTASLCFPLG